MTDEQLRLAALSIVSAHHLGGLDAAAERLRQELEIAELRGGVAYGSELAAETRRLYELSRREAALEGTR